MNMPVLREADEVVGEIHDLTLRIIELTLALRRDDVADRYLDALRDLYDHKSRPGGKIVSMGEFRRTRS